MIKTFFLKNQRQLRAIVALLERDSIQVKDLGFLAGALNPRQIISELRQQGFGDIIKTQRFKIIDRDGKDCHPGRYFISPEDKPIVQEFLKEDGGQAVLKKSQNSHKQHDRGEA